MQKLYRKRELLFSIILIVIYVTGASVCDSLSQSIGLQKSLTFVFLLIFSVIIFVFLRKENLLTEYGLCKCQIPLKKMLYFLPLAFLCLLNVITGAELTGKLTEYLLFAGSMICVGFLEEIIFRGFLFKAMAKDNLKSAVAVSSLTFGIGHIVNLFNGSGAETVSTLCQIVGATGFGFMCVMIFIKSKSLLPCIITHSVFNTFSVFAAETEMLTDIIVSVIMLIITVGYAIMITRLDKNDKNSITD